MGAWWAAENYLDSATLTADREVALLPVTKLQSPHVGRRYRVDGLSPGDTRTRVEIAFAAPTTIDRICWVRPRQRASLEIAAGPLFAATDLVRHEFSDQPDFSNTLYDSGDIASGVLPGWGYHAHILMTPIAGVTHAAFEFDALSRDTAPNNYVDWGRAFYGKAQSLGIDFAAPLGIRSVENARKTRAIKAPTLYVGRRRPYLRFDVVFRSIKSFERPAMLDFMHETGDGGRFLFGLSETFDGRNVIIGVNDTPALDQTSRAFSRFPFGVEEAL